MMCTTSVVASMHEVTFARGYIYPLSVHHRCQKTTSSPTTTSTSSTTPTSIIVIMVAVGPTDIRCRDPHIGAASSASTASTACIASGYTRSTQRRRQRRRQRLFLQHSPVRAQVLPAAVTAVAAEVDKNIRVCNYAAKLSVHVQTKQRRRQGGLCRHCGRRLLACLCLCLCLLQLHAPHAMLRCLGSPSIQRGGAHMQMT